MKNKRNTKTKNRIRLLTNAYIVMLMICIFLTLTSGFDLVSIIINGIMFIIIGWSFSFAKKRFKIVQTITSELKEATAQIKTDFDQSQMYLWNTYKERTGEEFFKEENLLSAYQEYLFEMKRLEILSNGGYKCEIDNYINKDFVDVVVKKNLLNLIPGTMTGLGILGTFIGLTVGLQNFNTGTAAEITNSIAPLMAGIKVAFHTSIYGMIFSLVFNFVYKQVLEDAYNELDIFLNVYGLYVTSDAEADNASNMQILLQKLPDAISQKVGEKIAEVLEPAFEKINLTMETFADKVSENQMEGVSEIVNSFVSEMNSSLGDSFKNLGEVINETCELQKQNSEFMQNILQDIEKMTTNIRDINEMSDKTIKEFSEYINKVEELQSIINTNFTSANIQMEEQNRLQKEQQEYIRILVEYEKQISEASNAFTTSMVEQIEALNKMEQDISDSTRENMRTLAEKASEYSESLAEVAKKQIQEVLALSNNTTGDMDRASKELTTASQQFNNQLINSLNATFDTFDKNLAEITRHLSGTIAEVDATTERVPQVVVAAYDGMEKSFEEMQGKLEALIHALDIMQRNLINSSTKSMKK